NINQFIVSLFQMVSQVKVRSGQGSAPDDYLSFLFKGFSVPWHLISVTLGILCLLLLVTVALLGTKISQYIQENHQQREEIGNLTREHHILQNDSYLKERLLINKTLEYNILKNESLQQKKEQDLLFSGRTYQRENEGMKGKLCESHLSYRGIKYYYFIPESQNWKGCKQTCQSYNSSLLKINDEDELSFTYPPGYPPLLILSLSMNLLLASNYTFMSSSGRGQCAFLTSTRTTPIECSKTYGCICEGRIDDLFSAHFDRYKKKR
uniref:C-type lectin domain-containing protein n=1 Tax=Ursus americanus TaxID=9643 RepID=A0A452QL66_URSAM